MSMLDELRDDDSFGDELEDDLRDHAAVVVQKERTFLGMTAVERMFLAIFLFMNVVVIGMALLLATGRIQF